MKIVPIAVALVTALLGIAGSTPARATDIDVYRADHESGNCRVVETTTTNRWGDEVTIRQRVCG
jgi:hypothetical protein